MPSWQSGRVSWFNMEKGYGFIEPDDGRAEVFLDYRSIQMPGLRQVSAGQLVTYTCRDGRSGPEATAVRPLTDIAEVESTAQSVAATSWTEESQ